MQIDETRQTGTISSHVIRECRDGHFLMWILDTVQVFIPNALLSIYGQCCAVIAENRNSCALTLETN